MAEILPGTHVCIPIGSREVIFNMASSRRDLARRLLRAFYTDQELIKSGFLNKLPNSDVIIPAIIGKMFSSVLFILHNSIQVLLLMEPNLLPLGVQW